jgi:oxygen-dependent protoporphyrinogen oxidase
MTRVVVIGGGIAGLTAGFSLIRGTPEMDVTVLEASSRIGGKVQTEPFAGLDLDTGPDSFLARVPAAIELCQAVGLGPDLIAPARGEAYLWTRDKLRRLPEGLVLGVPTDLWALARSQVLSPRGLARTALDLVQPARPSSPTGEDTAVGDLIRARLGAEAELRLVEPLIGGINAGRTDHLSLAVTAPQLADAARQLGRQRSLIRVLRAARQAAPPSGSPVFLTVKGGMARLTSALADYINARPDSEVQVGVAAGRLERVTGDPAGPGIHDGQQPARWRVTTTSGSSIDADAIVMAVPAPDAARLLGPLSAEAARQLRGIEYASVALTTLAYRNEDVGCPLAGSGFLVPRVEGRLMTACSWSGSKWPHLGTPGQQVMRVSAGRAGDGRALEFDDETLADHLHRELAAALHLRGRPVEVRVHRWIDAFPQFAPGHSALVTSIETALEVDMPGVVLAGAAYRGVGLATCIAGANAAADRVRLTVGAIPNRTVTP